MCRKLSERSGPTDGENGGNLVIDANTTVQDTVVMTSVRQVWIAFVEGHQSLDVAGPTEVFSGANTYLDHIGIAAPRYELHFIGPARGAVVGESGLGIVADHSWSDPIPGRCDDLVVAGGNGIEAALSDATLIEWVRSTARHADRIVSICSGSFVLAEAGLLDGRRATTHWARFDRFAERFPAVELDADALFVRDGNVITSAGVTAGIDLALSLVEDDHGVDAAHIVARHLVVFLRRPGGQSQFSAPTWSKPVETEPIRMVQSAIHACPGADLSIASLATRAGMSERNFVRVFTREVGESPGRYVEQVRVTTARRALESRSSGVATIAAEAGFGTSETMRRAFLRQLGVPPNHYRKRFSHAH